MCSRLPAVCACLLGAVLAPAIDAVPGNSAPTLRFTSLTIDDGLSVSGVGSVLQDRHGFMWFGTQDGLNRYDGHRVEVFRRVPFDTRSLADGAVYGIAEDLYGALWVSTLTALHRRDSRTGHFERFRYDPTDPYAPAERARSLLATDDGILWFGTMASGVDRLDPTTGRFTRFRHDPADPESLSSDMVTALHATSDGTLWIGTTNGLNRLQPDGSGAIARHFHDPARVAGDYTVADLANHQVPPDALRASIIAGLADDPRSSGVLWVATAAGLVRFDTRSGESQVFTPDDRRAVFTDIVRDPLEPEVYWLGSIASGLFRFDVAAGRFDQYRRDARARNTLSGDAVARLYADRSGMVWAVGLYTAIDRFNPGGLPFAHEYHVPEDPDSLVEDSIWGFAEDHDGGVWVATQGGLDRYDPATGVHQHFRPERGNPRSISSLQRFAMRVDSNGVLWAGAVATGIDRLDPGADGFRNYMHDPTDPTSLSSGAVFVVYEDGAGTIWVGTSRGLNHYDAAADRFRRVAVDVDPATQLLVVDLHEDRAGTFWVATSDGLREIDRESGDIHVHRYDPDDRSGLSSNLILTIHERAREPGVLWLGTGDGGLNRFDTRTGEVSHFTLADGLPDMVVYGILEDDRGHLWMSTNNGLSDFNPDERTFVNYGIESGLQSREFNRSAYLRSERTGEMYFGGVNGYNRFAPDRFARNLNPPDVALTGLSVFHRPVMGGGAPQAPLDGGQAIRLPAHHRSITFQFAALHYLNPARNRVVYRLDGFDTEWIDAGDERQATYTNLAPGSYRFRVRAANADNVWSEGVATLDVVVHPPWYRTAWAYALYLLALLAALYGLQYWYRRRLEADERHRSELEDRVRERTAQLERANRELEAFSYSVSHDLRAPLRAIEGYSAIVLTEHAEGVSSEGQRLLRRVGETVRRMAELIDDLLEFAQIGRRKPRTGVVDVANVVRTVVAELTETLDGRQVEFEGAELPRCVGDRAMVRQAFLNLIGNAVKYTRDREPAHIRIGAVRQGDFIRYHVADDGVGFDPKYANKLFGVFERLHRADEFEGTGIGLAIVQRVVQRHGGEVWAEGKLGEGATFYFTLPAVPE